VKLGETGGVFEGKKKSPARSGMRGGEKDGMLLGRAGFGRTGAGGVNLLGEKTQKGKGDFTRGGEGIEYDLAMSYLEGYLEKGW